MGLADKFTGEIHDQWKIYFANWPVDSQVALGDYGFLEGSVFRRIGNIEKDFKIPGETRNDPNDASLEYASSGEVSLAFTARGAMTPSGVSAAKAKLEIKFGSKESTYFKASGGKWVSYESTFDLGNRIMALWKKKNSPWERRYCVVTSLLEAGATTAVISCADNASLVLEASADGVAEIDLAGAKAGLSVVHSSNVGLKVVSENGMRPLIGLMKINMLSLLGLGIVPVGYYWGPA